MINCEHRTNARNTKSDQDSAVFTKRFLLPVAISSLQRNEYKRIYLNSPYDPTFRPAVDILVITYSDTKAAYGSGDCEHV